jgi:hypothetical protein
VVSDGVEKVASEIQTSSIEGRSLPGRYNKEGDAARPLLNGADEADQPSAPSPGSATISFFTIKIVQRL